MYKNVQKLIEVFLFEDWNLDLLYDSLTTIEEQYIPEYETEWEAMEAWIEDTKANCSEEYSN